MSAFPTDRDPATGPELRLTLDLRSGASAGASSQPGWSTLAWAGVGLGLGLAAGFAASLLRGRSVRAGTGYVAPAPAYGHRAVPEIDLRGQRPDDAGAVSIAGSRSTPVGASVSGGK